MSSLVDDCAFYFDEYDIDGITPSEILWVKSALHLSHEKSKRYKRKVILIHHPLRTGPVISETVMKYIRRGAVALESINALAVCAYVPDKAFHSSGALKKHAIERGLDLTTGGLPDERQLPLF